MTRALSPQARAVYAALAAPGTADDIVDRAGLILKTVGPRLSGLERQGLIECVDHVENARGRKVRLYAQVPEDRIEETKARASSRGPRRRNPRKLPLDDRVSIVRGLFKDRDLLEALANERAHSRAEIDARRVAREEFRERERLDRELLRQQRLAEQAEDPRLPYWRAWRKYTQGADAGRVLTAMLERDLRLAALGKEPLVEPGRWADGLRHANDMLRVTGRLTRTLRTALGSPAETCPACGADPGPEPETIDIEVLDDLATLGRGEP